MDEKRKWFEKPELEIVYFETDDITTSYTVEEAYQDEWTGENWQGEIV